MSAPIDLTGLTDADLADLIARATHLRAWIAAMGDETLFDGGGLYAPISVTDVLGRASADDLTAGLAHRDRLLCLLALGVGSSAQLGVDRFADERLFECLRELNRVVLQEAVAGLSGDRADEGPVAAADVLTRGGGVGIDPRPEQLDDVDRPSVHDAGELLSADDELVGVDRAIGHGGAFLSRVRRALGATLRRAA